MYTYGKSPRIGSKKASAGNPYDQNQNHGFKSDIPAKLFHNEGRLSEAWLSGILFSMLMNVGAVHPPEHYARQLGLSSQIGPKRKHHTRCMSDVHSRVQSKKRVGCLDLYKKALG